MNGNLLNSYSHYYRSADTRLLLRLRLVDSFRAKTFLDATKIMSQSGAPLVHQVIPLFDGITRALDNHAQDMTNAPAVRMAAVRGRKMLDKYYGLTDDSIVYRLAMCKSYCLIHTVLYMHANMSQLQYSIHDINPCIFKRLAGHVTGSRPLKTYCERNTTTTINQISQRLFQKKLTWYDLIPDLFVISFNNLHMFLQSPPSRNKYFDEFDFNMTSTAHPVDEWLNSPPISGADGLPWWSAMESHPLHRIAVDFLSIPGNYSFFFGFIFIII